MGKDVCDAYPEASALFRQADEILGFSLSRLCFEGPAEELNDTINTQPAIFTVSLAIWEVIRRRWESDAIAFVAGHSLGEYTALVVAGVLDFAEGLRLVRERGRLMKEAGLKNPGGMAAVLGLDDATVEEICRRIVSSEPGRCLQVANYNSPGQVVISGHRDALQKAIKLAREKGARRVVPLAVSIAAHSALMASTCQGMEKALDSTKLRDARVPVLANTSAKPITSPGEIRQELLTQLQSPVRWTESIRVMADRGVDTFVEIGPKNVLTGLIRRIIPSARTINVGKTEEIEAFLATQEADLICAAGGDDGARR